MAPSLERVLEALQQIAPLELAESWDRVGLLVEPYDERFLTKPDNGNSPSAFECVGHPIHRILVAIDLTERVLEEAIRLGAELIVAYHPPIFDPVRTLRVREARARCLMRAVQSRTAIYSPHTALDAAEGGVNDWLALGLGKPRQVEPLIPAGSDGNGGAGLVSRSTHGSGRRVLLEQPVALDALVSRVKQYLGLEHVSVATAAPHRVGGATVSHIGVCAGAGGSVFDEVDLPAGPEVYLTGEMRHHQVLSMVSDGASVILTGHTHSERGYLPVLSKRIAEELGAQTEVFTSEFDLAPLTVH